MWLKEARLKSSSDAPEVRLAEAGLEPGAESDLSI
jgi:hypothetical protein